MSEPRPFSYVIPHRRRWRWEILEYSGTAVLAASDGLEVTFQAIGPLTRKVHPRRFWFARSARRYVQRMGEAKLREG